ncbi:MAG: thiol-disulfide oxidoreductase DCC family protein [Hyphomicrobium sp.]
MRSAAYSYRADPLVPRFDDAAPLIIFDGLCVLCSTGVQWMLKRDPNGTSKFAAIQEPIPRALYRHYNLDPAAFDTFMVLADGVPHLRWAGALAAARTLPAPWRWLGLLGSVIPSALGDPIYDWVQRNRLRWFGVRDVCLAPDAATASRFLTADRAAAPAT